jgi:hypothetical protein
MEGQEYIDELAGVVVLPDYMKQSKIEFPAHSYLSFEAVEFDKSYEDYENEEPPGYTIYWDEDPIKFAQALKKAADFLKKYKNGHNITVHID